MILLYGGRVPAGATLMAHVGNGAVLDHCDPNLLAKEYGVIKCLKSAVGYGETLVMLLLMLFPAPRPPAPATGTSISLLFFTLRAARIDRFENKTPAEPSISSDSDVLLVLIPYSPLGCPSKSPRRNRPP